MPTVLPNGLPNPYLRNYVMSIILQQCPNITQGHLNQAIDKICSAIIDQNKSAYSGFPTMYYQITAYNPMIYYQMMMNRPFVAYLPSFIFEQKESSSVGNNASCVVCPFKKDPFDGIFAYLYKLNNENPVKANFVKISFSSLTSRFSSPSVQFLIDPKDDTCHQTEDKLNQWMQFDFIGRKVSLSGYSMKTHHMSGNGHTQHFKIEGSNDGRDWNMIDSRNNYLKLNRPDAVATEIIQPSPFYSHIRITQTGENTLHRFSLRLVTVEFFGSIRED